MFGASDYRIELGENLGIEEWQYDNLVSGRYIDVNYNALSLVNKISSYGNDLSALNFFRKVPMHLIEVGFFYGVVILCLLSSLSSREKIEKRRFIFTIVIMGFLGYFVLYLLASYKTGVADFLVLAPISFYVLLCTNNISMQKDEQKSVRVSLFLASVVLYSTFSGQVVTSVNKNDMSEQLYEYAEENLYSWHLIDLNEYLRDFSVWKPYKISIANTAYFPVNGVYRIIPIYDVTMDMSELIGSVQVDGYNVDGNVSTWRIE